MTIKGIPVGIVSGVYSIRHESGAEYVGGSINVRNRVLRHLNILQRSEHPSVRLQEFWNNSDSSEWELLILERCGLNTILETEQKHMDGSVLLLNYMTKADRNWKGREWPADFKAKCSERIQRLISEERFGRGSWSGETSERHADLMRQYVDKGRIGSKNWSKETREKAGKTQSRLNSTPEKKAAQSEKAKKLHSEGRLGAKTWKPGEREKRAERMRRLHAEGRVGPKSHKRYKEKHLPAVSLPEQTGPSDPTQEP